MSTPLDFIIEIALPWIGRRTRSVALGCLLALGGCESADAPEATAPTVVPEASALDRTARTPRVDAERRRAGPPVRSGLDRPRLERPGRRRQAIAASRVRRAPSTEAHASTGWSRAGDAAWSSPDAGGIANGETPRAPRWCGTCHADRDTPSSRSTLDEWHLGATSTPAGWAHAGPPAPGHPRAADWHHGAALDERGAPSACATCHAPSGAAHPFALRVFDTVEVAGAPAEHLGSGAMCASCHNGGASASEPDGATRTPQAEMLLGRGARLAAPMDEGAHRFIVNTCVRCHMTRPADSDPLRGRAGGHTFSIRARSGEPVLSQAACAPCHGDTPPGAIGAGDWNGDGVREALGAEHRRGLEVARERLRAQLARLAIDDACASPRRAWDAIEREGRLHLVDDEGALLGDCDANGRIEGDEVALTTAQLPARLADAAHDLAMLHADGSAGVHNPAYAFRVLDALQRALR